MKIQTLTLLTNHLNEMKNFYHHTLDFDLVHDEAHSFSVQIGASLLVFKKTEDPVEPFYHFAMNIPQNLMKEAKAWLNSIITLNTHYGEDEVFFENWNAHAIYFTDPAGNIVELIARHDDQIPDGHLPFNSKLIMNISEIGIVTNQVQPMVQKILSKGLKEARPGSEYFAPLGDVEGLFIVVKNKRIWFFSDKPAAFFPVHVIVENIGQFTFYQVNEVLFKEISQI
ncbi:VOC family protein [Alkalicoccobacillus murimartini]|uniref:Catechol 2,3-dioxygenase-like lactoylglutathione lyase family enzyme n=1 Tax=Alkalicoccobacillus murimartini TaxID=171685 RepID=A0ABT9YDR8_9BACI|nr:ring-cleaving dioxygenase [Alkalicoccobacillus murimartini]MDQ0205681.1 catechol 2,3-dioxygenase-like lactoylglutathione lyase family enzyme [Alkalicoccobacillus murimartini]